MSVESNKILELQFKDAGGRARKITINSPADGIDPLTAQETLAAVVNADIFQNDLQEDMFAEAVGARYVTRSIEDIYSADDK